MVPIHSYGNCSVAQGNIKDRIASASWEPSHALVHDVTDVEIFSYCYGVFQMPQIAWKWGNFPAFFWHFSEALFCSVPLGILRVVRAM